MKHRVLVSVLLLASAIAFGQPSPASHAWAGVWQLKESGKPGMTITIADDSGALAGTIVFEVLNRETGERIAIVSRSLVNPHLEGSALTFQVKHILKPHLKGETQPLEDSQDATDIVEMKLTPTSPGAATLSCGQCGERAAATLVKE